MSDFYLVLEGGEHQRRLPNFDDQVRRQSARVASAEAQLAAHIGNTKDFLAAETVQKLFAKVQEERKASDILAARINRLYKQSKESGEYALEQAKELKREIEVLEEKLASDKNATEEVEEYRRKMEDQEETIKIGKDAIKQVETYKRKIEVLEDRLKSKDTASPAPKRRRVDEEAPTPFRKIAPRVPSSFTTLTTSDATTPKPKASRTNFTGLLPVLRRSTIRSTIIFPTERILRPNGLTGPPPSSHIHAVLQGYAASVQSHEAWRKREVGDGLSGHFFYLTIDMQHPQTTPLDTSKLQLVTDEEPKPTYFYNYRTRQGSTPSSSLMPPPPIPDPPPDPTRFIDRLMKMCGGKYFNEGWHIVTLNHVTCPQCRHPGNHDGMMVSGSWTVPVRPVLADEQKKRTKVTPTRNLMQLLKDMMLRPETVTCPGFGCWAKGAQQVFLGFAGEPVETIIFSFPRVQGECTSIYLPLEQDFGPLMRRRGHPKAKYRLVTVVKLIDKGVWAAYVHAEDGKWWRVISEQVVEVRPGDWQADQGGQLELAFYAKL